MPFFIIAIGLLLIELHISIIQLIRYSPFIGVFFGICILLTEIGIIFEIKGAI